MEMGIDFLAAMAGPEFAHDGVTLAVACADEDSRKRNMPMPSTDDEFVRNRAISSTSDLRTVGSVLLAICALLIAAFLYVVISGL